MIKLSELAIYKPLFEILAGTIPGGIMFCIIETDTIIWRKSSSSFPDDILYEGYQLERSSITLKAIQNKQSIKQNLPRTEYGTRLNITSIPILNEDEETCYGALSIIIPLLHPVVASFSNFAPIIVELFHDGLFLYVTDKQKVINRQASQKFDAPNASLGYILQETDPSYQVLQTGKPVYSEKDASAYGIPVFISAYPLISDDEVVATLGVIVPKETASVLNEMASNLESGLSNISSAIQQLAASANEIHTNEQILNDEINSIISISEEINSISSFIKEIADETKMLGLNAAIEAARAGTAGKGFGVVADEIRKLSSESKNTVPKINKLTEAIKNKVETASKKSNGSLDASQEQAAASQEITSSIEEITAMSVELAKIASEI